MDFEGVERVRPKARERWFRVLFHECLWNGNGFEQYMPAECLFQDPTRRISLGRSYNSQIAMQLSRLDPPHFATDELRAVFLAYRETFSGNSCFLTAVANAAKVDDAKTIVDRAKSILRAEMQANCPGYATVQSLLAKDWGSEDDDLTREERRMRVLGLAACQPGGLYIVSPSRVRHYPGVFGLETQDIDLSLPGMKHFVGREAMVIALYDGYEDAAPHFDACHADPPRAH